MGAKGVASDKSEYGPSWRDVYETWDRVEKELGLALELHARRTTSLAGVSGMRCLLAAAGEDVLLSSFGYGPAYPNSAKTFPAALYLALLGAEEAGQAHRVWTDGEIAQRVSTFFAPGKP